MVLGKCAFNLSVLFQLILESNTINSVLSGFSLSFLVDIHSFTSSRESCLGPVTCFVCRLIQIAKVMDMDMF